jgi:hypothetical protein
MLGLALNVSRHRIKCLILLQFSLRVATSYPHGYLFEEFPRFGEVVPTCRAAVLAKLSAAPALFTVELGRFRPLYRPPRPLGRVEI